MIKKILPVVLFISGFGIFIFTRMSKLVPTIPIAILISFVFILRFSRTQSAGIGIWLTLLGFIISINIGLWGLFEVGGEFSSLFFNLIRSSLLAHLYFLPFMIDRLIYPKFKDKGLVSILVFPVITTAVFFILTIEGPFEGALQPAKFSFGIIQFMEFLSLFGVFGFVFLTSWLASVINHLLEMKFEWERTKKLIIIAASVVLTVFLFGIIKTSPLMSPEKEKVKVAAIVIHAEDSEVIQMQEIYNNKLISPFEKRLSEIKNLTQAAASHGAKIVTFQEFAIIINEENHDRLQEQFRKMSEENDVYLSISYAYFAKEGKGKNKHILIDNNGKILLDYTKRYLQGMGDVGETLVFVKGPEIIQSADTPYGKIAVSICRDMEMAKYIIQAGKAHVDIMLSSSYEWPQRYTPNAIHRSIENGFSVVRAAYNGVSYSQDYNGKILNKMFFGEPDTGIMYTDIPTKGVKTLYPYIGHIWGWISLLGLIALLFVAVISGRKDKKTCI